MIDQPKHQARSVRLVWTALSRAHSIYRQIIEQVRGLRSRRRRQQFSDRHQPGVFIIEAPATVEAIAGQAAATGLAVRRIAGADVRTKAEFLALVAHDLEFPDYFGHNWDAFADCIGDLAWLPAPGYVLILDGFDRLATSDPRAWTTALTILRRATAEWARTGTPMYVFARVARDAMPAMPVPSVSAPADGELGS